MKAAEDFLQLVMYAHIVTAAKTILGYNFTSSIGELAKVILANYVLLPELTADAGQPVSEDKVNLYACETLTLSLLWHGFYYSIKEANGDRMIRYWRFLLIVFKPPNYAKEAILLLMQYLFSERMKAQLFWSRCINTKGAKGCNMPADLHMEYSNRCMRGMGGNITPQAIVKAAKCMGTTHQVCSFEEHTMTVKAVCDTHSHPSVEKDLDKIVEVLWENERMMYLLHSGRGNM